MKTVQSLKLKCRSVFAPYAYEYIEQRHALGFRCDIEAAFLNQFDSLCMERGILEPVLSKELLDAWGEKRPYESASNHYMRVQRIRSFTVFCQKNGVDAPSAFHPLPSPPKTFMPYIFTQDEIARFFAAVDDGNRAANCHSTLRHLVMPVLFRMLYACGLRVTEALRLKSTDVDLDQGTLLILCAKGDKDRLVAMSESLNAICQEYRSNTTIKNFGSEYFFPAPDRGFYDSSTIYDWFRQYLFAAGIGHGGRSKGPRLHDLRHTFSVHTLGNWVAQGKDLYVCLPILSAYLGHKGLKSTQKYLRLVPEAYSSVTAPFEAGFGYVFPEVPDEEL